MHRSINIKARQPVSRSTFLVTGATSGIGRATAAALAGTWATVVIVGRSASRCAAVAEEIAGRTGNPKIEYIAADLSSMDEVRRLAKVFKERHSELTVLINNAGMVSRERRLTADGIEATFAVNYLSRFLLTLLLLDLLLKSAPSRIVDVSGAYHASGRLHIDDINLVRGYSLAESNSQSKLANLLFTHELARRLQGTQVTINSLHPGVVRTGLIIGNRSLSLPVRLLYGAVSPFLKSPEQGAETPVYLATSPEVDGVSGEYFVDKLVTPAARHSRDPELESALWELSVEMVGLKQEETPIGLREPSFYPTSLEA